ncbi:hypothetical protein FI146_480008 [Flavobacterium psychrophilum]|nr:hypothetical protein FI146_480008 [Flavobacterium psychrophilum]
MNLSEKKTFKTFFFTDEIFETEIMYISKRLITRCLFVMIMVE